VKSPRTPTRRADQAAMPREGARTWLFAAREAHLLASIIKLLSPYNKTGLARQIKQLPRILLGLEILAQRAGRGHAEGGSLRGAARYFVSRQFRGIGRESRCPAQSLTFSEFTSSPVQEKIRGRA
jgi:hypothetical protein